MAIRDEFDVMLVDVTKRFDGMVAVDNVSLNVRRGEFFSLLGPSGCGKTTTLRMIAGFEFPDSGELRIRERVVNNVPAFRRETNLVFQQLALFPHLDVYDNVAFGLRIKRFSKAEVNERVSRILGIVQLDGFEKRRINQLSGGQQQRVAIARALVNEPAVLLLDEPLGALDLKLRLQMQLELKALQQRLGTTFIYVTHDQGEALTMSDRVAVMNNGRLEQIGPGRDIYLQPQSTFVAQFIGETNLLRGSIVEFGDGVGIIETAGMALTVSSPRALQSGAKVNLSIRPESVDVWSPASPLSDQGPNVFSARVTDVTFFGSTVRYQMRLESGETVDTQQLAGQDVAFVVGDEALLELPPAALVVLDDSPLPTESVTEEPSNG